MWEDFGSSYFQLLNTQSLDKYWWFIWQQSITNIDLQRPHTSNKTPKYKFQCHQNSKQCQDDLSILYKPLKYKQNSHICSYNHKWTTNKLKKYVSQKRHTHQKTPIEHKVCVSLSLFVFILFTSFFLLHSHM